MTRAASRTSPGDAVSERTARTQMVLTARRLDQLGLNRGSSGNIGVRCSGGFLVTPSGVSPALLRPAAMVLMDMDGAAKGPAVPSSEWRIHRDILFARQDVGAVVHTHSTFATTLATLRTEIPPFHYMIAVAGGDSIRCAEYALFGTQELSNFALAALEGRLACLLANHGLIALGRDLAEASSLAGEVESLCEQYWRALQIGSPHILSKADMSAVLERFKSYGQWREA
jgi:L-fuculose-phosphate aldolase